MMPQSSRRWQTGKLLLLLTLLGACRRDRGPMPVARQGQPAATDSKSAPPASAFQASPNGPPVPAPAAKPTPPPAPEVKVLRGLYLRTSDSSAFRPCGDKDYHRVVGRGDALGRLRDMYRFSTPFIGRPLFAI